MRRRAAAERQRRGRGLLNAPVARVRHAAEFVDDRVGGSRTPAGAEAGPPREVLQDRCFTVLFASSTGKRLHLRPAGRTRHRREGLRYWPADLKNFPAPDPRWCSNAGPVHDVDTENHLIVRRVLRDVPRGLVNAIWELKPDGEPALGRRRGLRGAPDAAAAALGAAFVLEGGRRDHADRRRS
jgi:hypothetical protein